MGLVSAMSEASSPSLESSTRDLLLFCLQARWHPERLDDLRSGRELAQVDWRGVAALSEREAVAPLLFSVLRNQYILPSAVEKTLHRSYVITAARNTAIMHQLADVLRRLQGQGIPTLVLKGAALAASVYGEMAERPMGDIDLLVEISDTARALRALGECGYQRVDVDERGATSESFENEIMVARSGGASVPIELHWSLFDSPHHQRVLPIDWFWDTAVQRTVADTPAMTLGVDALVLHLCGHLVLHHHGQGLLWHHDLAEILWRSSSELCWDVILSKGSQCDLVLSLQRVLHELETNWGAPVPLWVRSRLAMARPTAAESRVVGWLTTEKRSVGARFWADLASMSGWMERCRYAAGCLFPSSRYLMHRYGMPSPWLTPVFYLYRWLVGLRGLIRR